MGEDTVIINMEDSQILLLAPEDSERKEKELRRCCERMIEISQNTYQIEVFVVAGIICTGLDEIREEYKKILEIIDYQFFASESSYILRDNECRNKKQSDMLPMYFNKIDTCIKLKDYKGIRDEFDKVFDYIDRNVGFSSIYIKYNFTYIMKKMCEGLNTEEHLVDVVEKIYHARSLESVRQVVVQFITQVEQDHEAVSPDNRLVSMAKKLVGEKYQEVSLGVSYIADELNVSLPYLSTLFKMETGQTLVKYITSYRIEQAKYLLRMSNMKVADVAEKVGYLNTSYFISLFRNREGCSPQQYREKEFNHENKEA